MKNIGLLLLMLVMLNPLYASILQKANEGDLAGVQECIENGAKLNTQDNSGKTALMGASFNGELEIVKLLVESGADINIQDKNDNKALGFASADEGYKEVAEYLENLK